MTQMLQLSVIQIDAMYKYLHTIDHRINLCIVRGNAIQCNIYMMHVQTLITQWVAMLVCLLGIIVSTLAGWHDQLYQHKCGGIYQVSVLVGQLYLYECEVYLKHR